MKPVTRKLTIYRGGDYEEVFVLKNKTTGLPLNLTGYSGYAQVRDKSGKLIAELTVDIDGPAGRVSLSLARADTSTAPKAVDCSWSLFLVSPTGKARPYMLGPAEFVITSTVVATT